MDQDGVTLSTDERVRQAVERRRNAQQQKGSTGATSTNSQAGNEHEDGPAHWKRHAAAIDEASNSITADNETGGSAATDRAEGFGPVGGVSGYERQAATEAEQLLERLPGEFERIKADEARRRRMALEARGASPQQVRAEASSGDSRVLAKKPRYLDAPAAVAQREALARDRSEAQRQFQKQPVPSPRAVSTTSASTATVTATASAVAVGSSAWFARRAASMASLNALIAPTNSVGASQSRRNSRGSVSIGRRRNQNLVGTDAAAPAVTSSNGAALYDTNCGTRRHVTNQQDSGVRALYHKRQPSQEIRRDSGNVRSSNSSSAGHMLSRRHSDHQTYGDSDKEDQVLPWGERSIAAEKHWRPVLQIRQQQRKAKALLSVLEESGWSLSECQKNCDKATAAVVVAHWHAAGMGGRSLVPPPAATLPWPVSSTATIGVEGRASAALLGGANPLLRNKIPRVPKKVKEQREMERHAEQQAQVVREEEDQQRAREKHLLLEQQVSQHRKEQRQQEEQAVLRGDYTSRDLGSTVSDGAEAGGARTNAMAAEAFLTRMQYTSLGDALVSQDKIESRRDTERGSERTQTHKDSVTVKSHAIDALSAVVKPVLKRYYKSKAISSADDFKHLCAISR